MTFQVTVEIDTGDHFRKIIALGKYDPKMLVVLLTIAFQCISRTRFVIKSGFPWVDLSMFQDIQYFRLADLPAIHSAPGMPTVFKLVKIPIKTIIINILRVSGPEKKGDYRKYKQKNG